MKKIRLTMAQAVVRFLAAQKVEVDGKVEPIFGGVLPYLAMVMWQV